MLAHGMVAVTGPQKIWAACGVRKPDDLRMTRNGTAEQVAVMEEEVGEEPQGPPTPVTARGKPCWRPAGKTLCICWSRQWPRRETLTATMAHARSPLRTCATRIREPHAVQLQSAPEDQVRRARNFDWQEETRDEAILMQGGHVPVP